VPRGVLVVNAVEIGGNRVNTCTIDEAFGAPNVTRTQYQIKCDPKDPVFLKLRQKPPAVRQAGEMLYNALVADPAGLKFFANQAPACPVFIQLDTPEAEELPWETLWENQKYFMVLDPQGRWPIARLASAAQRAEPLRRAISEELRIAVVLAAAGERGESEWQSIADAMDGLATPLHVLALVSEKDAKEKIAADATTWASQGLKRTVEVEFVGDSTTLVARLRAHIPNVVHFFCHGIADVRPQLELETRADRSAKKDRGSITLGSEMLVELARARSLWLVVLNCCQGAKTAPQLHSLARDLVAAGVPAVVAMRESVEVNDANLFAQHFFTALFPQLKAMFDMRNNPAVPHTLRFSELVWLRAVDAARRQLSTASNRVAGSSAEWTFPVLYVHRDPLDLYPRVLKPLTTAERLGLLTQLDVLRAVRMTLDMASEAEEIARRAKLDADIRLLEAQLVDE
jgi:hypothetical protein